MYDIALTRLELSNGTADKFYQVWQIEHSTSGLRYYAVNYGRRSIGGVATMGGTWGALNADSWQHAESEVLIQKKMNKGYQVTTRGLLIVGVEADLLLARLGLTEEDAPAPIEPITVTSVPDLGAIQQKFATFSNRLSHQEVTEAILLHQGLTRDVQAVKTFLLECEGQLEVSNVLLSQLLTSQGVK